MMMAIHATAACEESRIEKDIKVKKIGKNFSIFVFINSISVAQNTQNWTSLWYFLVQRNSVSILTAPISEIAEREVNRLLR